MTGTYKAYRQTAAEANDGLGPLIALFNTLAGNLHRAACAQRDNDIATRCDEARHALLVIGFLEDWVARGAEGELAAGLKAFYDSLRRAVIAAGFKQSAEIFELQMKRVLELRQQWQAIEQRLEAPGPEILRPEFNGPAAYFAAQAEGSRGSWSA